MWQKLFQTKHFRVQLVDDVAGVSLCGALKSELPLFFVLLFDASKLTTRFPSF